MIQAAMSECTALSMAAFISPVPLSPLSYLCPPLPRALRVPSICAPSLYLHPSPLSLNSLCFLPLSPPATPYFHGASPQRIQTHTHHTHFSIEIEIMKIMIMCPSVCIKVSPVENK